MPSNTPSPLPSEVLAARLLELRDRHGWTQSELAARMTAYGWSWDRTTVAKVEASQRQVAVDELVSIAFVLGVSPVALIVPTGLYDQVSVTPNTVRPASVVWRWITGTFQMGREDPGEGVQSRDVHANRRRFYDEATPDYVATAERRLPGLLSAHDSVSRVQASAGVFGDEMEIDWVDLCAAALEQAHDDISGMRRRLRRLRSTGKGQ